MSISIEINYEYVGLELETVLNHDVDIEDNIDSIVTKFILDNNIWIRRGDVINLIPEDKRYRNDGTLIWTGEKAIWLEWEPDDYGTVPSIFEVSPGVFSPDYWINVIVHNRYFWICDLYKQQLINNLHLSNLFTEEEIPVTKFTHNGIDYIVCFERHFTKDKIIDIILDPNTCYFYDAEEIDANVTMKENIPLFCICSFSE